MTEPWRDAVLLGTKAKIITNTTIVQTLWSGYGKIIRAGLSGSDISSCIVKHIHPKMSGYHPRGWNTDISHERKLSSYRVESNWYKHWAQHCNTHCRVPKCYMLDSNAEMTTLVLEDIDASGYPIRHSSLKPNSLLGCIQWLAYFHAKFLDEAPQGLWPTGTYWHLATRPDEFKAMPASELKDAAKLLDKKLSECQFQTLVHGDAKLANFCFSNNSERVVAVDFQYVGGGCGIKDLAYFISSCLNEKQSQQYEAQILDDYFYHLKAALKHYDKNIDTNALEVEWRQLYAVAWADFTRFLLGWMPNHKKLNAYTAAKTAQALKLLS